MALGKQKSGAHHPKAPNVVLIAAASPPDGIDKKLMDRIKGDEKVQRILDVSSSISSLMGPMSFSSASRTREWTRPREKRRGHTLVQTPRKRM